MEICFRNAIKKYGKLPHEYAIIESKEEAEVIEKVIEKYGFHYSKPVFKDPNLQNKKYVVYNGFIYWIMKDKKDFILNRACIYGYKVDVKNRKFEYVQKYPLKEVYEQFVPYEQ
ncbi:MAG: hypothetical protein QXL82_02120 [Candidatus Aenigmatarchaeota archaeon]